MPSGLVIFAGGNDPIPAVEHEAIAAEPSRRTFAEAGFVTSGRLRARLDRLHPPAAPGGPPARASPEGVRD
jgi:hypothetical protein